MCNPALILGIGGAVIQGIAGQQKMKTEAANNEAAAAAAERDAKLQRESGSYQGTRTLEQGQQLIGRQIATYAAKGISPSTGTPLDVIRSTGADVGLDVAAARYGYARAIENKQYEAKVYQMNARSATSAAPFAFISPLINAGATYLQGAYG